MTYLRLFDCSGCNRISYYDCIDNKSPEAHHQKSSTTFTTTKQHTTDFQELYALLPYFMNTTLII